MKQNKSKKWNNLYEILIKIKEEMIYKDWEKVHSLYDDAMKIIAERDHKLMVRKLDEVVKGATFWYS